MRNKADWEPVRQVSHEQHYVLGTAISSVEPSEAETDSVPTIAKAEGGGSDARAKLTK